MALSFPTSPAPGAVYAAPNGVNYTWDNGAGVWTAGEAAANPNIVAWVNFNSQPASPTIRGAYNVSSVTKTGTGLYTVNFTTALVDANYASIAMVGGTIGVFEARGGDGAYPATTGASVVCINDGSIGTLADPLYYNVVFIR